jgi:hypothetical protein
MEAPRKRVQKPRNAQPRPPFYGAHPTRRVAVRLDPPRTPRTPPLSPRRLQQGGGIPRSLLVRHPVPDGTGVKGGGPPSRRRSLDAGASRGHSPTAWRSIQATCRSGREPNGGDVGRKNDPEMPFPRRPLSSVRTRQGRRLQLSSPSASRTRPAPSTPSCPRKPSRRMYRCRRPARLDRW